MASHPHTSALITTMNSRASFFDELLKSDRKLELDYEHASADAPEIAKRVRVVASAFLEDYAVFNGMSKEAVLASYAKTIRRYATDIRAFVASGKYPLQVNANQEPLSRTDYDLFLILTIIVTRHRCAIMEEISRIATAGKSLVIGVGSGVELGFIQAAMGGDAYDLYINPFARTAFPKWRFHEELYRPAGDKYDAIYAIELLEHLDQPYTFLSECAASLSPGGRLVVTTATNVPQFDHRFNFTSDDEFRRRISELGLELESKRVIPHAYPRTEIAARNDFYVLTKK
jgi:SAM-dependent methyltransferase